MKKQQKYIGILAQKIKPPKIMPNPLMSEEMIKNIEEANRKYINEQLKERIDALFKHYQIDAETKSGNILSGKSKPPSDVDWMQLAINLAFDHLACFKQKKQHHKKQ